MPLLLALLLTALPAAAQTVLLPEQAVGEPATQDIGGGGVYDIASDGTNFMIVSIGIDHYVPTDHTAMLVDAHGNPLLKTSIQLPASGAFVAAVASSGRGYLIVWSDYDGDTRGMRVDMKGRVLDETPIVIQTPGTFGMASVSAAWDGQQYVVVSAVGGPPVFLAARVSEAGEVLQNGIAIESGLYAPTVVAGHGVSVFLWRDSDGVLRGRSMTAAGILAAPYEIGHGTAPLAAAGNDGFLVLTRTPDGMEAHHLGLNGEPDRAAVLMPLKSAYALFSAGAAYLLLYPANDTGDIAEVHVNAAGEFIDTPRTLAAHAMQYVELASNGTDIIVAWSYKEAPYFPTYTFARGLEDPTAVNVHRGYVPQRTPRVTWRGNRAVVSWTETGAHEKVIGSPDVAVLSESVDAAVASSPAETLHAVARGQQLYAWIAGHDPVLIDSDGADTNSVRAVWTGNDFIVVWARRTTSGWDILGARLDRSGGVINGASVLANAATLRDLAIGASASQVLMVYADGAVVHGLRLTASGAVPTDDVSTFAEVPFNTSSYSVASDGENFMVVWANERFNRTENTIGARLINANGNAVSPALVASGLVAPIRIASAFWTGSDYRIVWQSATNDLFSMRIAADAGQIPDTLTHLGKVDGIVTSFACGPGGQIAVAFTRGDRAYTAFIVAARQRAAAHR